jgi:uncharacterized protein
MGSRVAPSTREPGWIFHHGLRVARISLWLREKLEMDIDRDLLFVGALFHDVGKEVEPHNQTGAVLTRALLEDHCPALELDLIAEMILHHNQRKQPNSYPPRILILQDADALDHVGAIDVWMAFYWSGVHGEGFQDHLDYFTGPENELYRSTLRESLNYQVSREEFDRRIAFEDEFFQVFRRVYREGM